MKNIYDKTFKEPGYLGSLLGVLTGASCPPLLCEKTGTSPIPSFSK